ncbi:MAG TPA: nucleotidyl transferase AbiEii/AbiGii toxin family protein [Syntrophales bacterium]|nr:nucleotidyl transferase AbiEii/AbiGii toxin family protein [Syntrophales bacterium]
MKTGHDTYIRRAEIAQLILLHQLYMQRNSHALIFQGGTALRWCYGGSRFSEDLDFVTTLAPQTIGAILRRVLPGIEKLMIPHFGVGSVKLTEKASRSEAFKCFVTFEPQNSRDKVSVKLEFESLSAQGKPEARNHILSSLPAVSYLIAAGEFRVPRPHTVVVAETPGEILSDKVRSLLERPYLKGRDLYDVWYLRTALQPEMDPVMLAGKFVMYRAPFCARRTLTFFSSPTEEGKKMMREAMEGDLSRFLPPDVLAVYRANGFAAFLDAVQILFRTLEERGVRLP